MGGFARFVALATMVAVVACGGDDESSETAAASGGAAGSQTVGTSVSTSGSAGGAGGQASVSSSLASVSAQGVGGAAVVVSAASTVGVGGAGGAQPSGPWDGPLYALQEVDLGQVEVNVPIEFEIPDRTIGLTLLAETAKSGGWVGFQDLKAEGAGSVVSNFAVAGKNLTIFAGYGVSAVANPQSDLQDAWPIKTGKWLTTLSGNTGGPQNQLRAWVRRTADGQFHGGAMDFNVFLAPNTTYSLYVKTMLASLFDNHFGPKLGLSLGKVLYTSLDAKYTVVDTGAEYDEMLATSAGMGAIPAVNLFIVADFLNDNFGGAIGIAGGIPGSPMKHGTTMSGVALQPSGDPNHDATVLAHEIGHLGGLFHTTEFAVDATDPLGDTVSCPSSTIKNSPGSCPDITNMMFPMAAGGSEISAAQARVMQGSALYRGVLLAGGQASAAIPTRAKPGDHAHSMHAALAVKGRGVTVKGKRVPADALEQALGGVWCARDSGYEAALFASLGSGGVARLRALAVDNDAFDLVRSRALLVLKHASNVARRPVGLTALSLEVLRKGAPRQTALTAISILQNRAPHRLAVLSDRLRAGADPVVVARLRAR